MRTRSDFLPHRITPRLAYSDTVEGNEITVSISPSDASGVIVVELVRLGNTTGTGLAESLTVECGSDEVYAVGFTIAGDRELGNSRPIAGRPGEAVTVKASATNLTGGYLAVVYRDQPG